MKRKNCNKGANNSIWERIKSWFVKSASPTTEESEIRIPSDEELGKMEEDRLTQYYGVDEDGHVTMPYTLFDMNSIGWRCNVNGTQYTLVDIDDYREKVNIFWLICCFHGTGKAEWEFTMGYRIIKGLREAWKNGEDTVDLTLLMNMEMWTRKPANYNGKVEMINGEECRVLSVEDVRNRVLSICTIVEETPEEVKIRINVPRSELCG